MHRAVLLIGFVFSFLFFVILGAPSEGLCARPPLMGEAACFVRKLCVLGMLESCKWFWRMELKISGKSGGSRIMQTESMRN